MSRLTFSSFVLSMGTHALVALGDAPHPETGTTAVDLDSARELIDILVLLRDKTEGNLEDEESQLLQRLLTDLRMRFVQKRS